MCEKTMCLFYLAHFFKVSQHVIALLHAILQILLMAIENSVLLYWLTTYLLSELPTSLGRIIA